MPSSEKFEKVENLILEHLKKIQAEQSDSRDRDGQIMARLDTVLDDGYRAMASDQVREADAMQWSNALATDMADEAR